MNVKLKSLVKIMKMGVYQAGGKNLSLQSEQHLPVGYFALHAPLHDSHSSVVCA